MDHDNSDSKPILTVVLTAVVLILLPLIIAVMTLRDDTLFDYTSFEAEISQSVDAPALQHLESTLEILTGEMKQAGYDADAIQKAQVICTLALSGCTTQPDFVPRLIGCFEEDQSDSALIGAINAEFGTHITRTDYSQIMGAISTITLTPGGYIDPGTKNNRDLVQWAIAAHAQGWGYVYGTYGTVLTRQTLQAKQEQYPDEVTKADEKWLNRRTADCVGLIKGYGWYDPESGSIQYGTHGMPDVSANEMYAAARQKGPISTMPEIPGLAVWHAGHIGIYIGGGVVIQAANPEDGVIRVSLSATPWTHWLMIPYISYVT